MFGDMLSSLFSLCESAKDVLSKPPARAHFGENHQTILVWMQRLLMI